MHVNYAVNISLITATEDLLQNIWQENGLMSVSSIYIVMLALTYLFFSTIWGSIKEVTRRRAQVYRVAFTDDIMGG
jgi:hypothetical protein